MAQEQKLDAGGPVHLDDGGDPSDTPAIDTAAPKSTSAAVTDAVSTIDEAMQYGRQMYGLPTDNQGALPAANPFTIDTQGVLPTDTQMSAAKRDLGTLLNHRAKDIQGGG